MGDCACNSGVKIIYSCSGAADVGELSDRAVRQLRKEGIAQGSCIAAIGVELSGYVQSAKGADMTIAIDGCPVGCARLNLENIGVTPVAINLAELGFKKGESPYSETLLCGCGGNC
ncbi:MAG: zinc-binding protein [Spirochaetae bacterium HGW-Spirochaetae-5]|nr:MAG: zinc-binding protein [Spirochaetae bacterium HGW-Spirochaetae-5]